MRSRSVPHSDSRNHSRSVSKHMCPGLLLQTSCPFSWKTQQQHHLGMKAGKGVLSLSSDWFSSLRSIQDDIPKENPTALKAAWSHRPWITRNLWWSMSYCNAIWYSWTCYALSPSSLPQEGKMRTPAPPDFLHYVCISLAVNMQRHCSFLMHELFFSYWWKTAAPGHTFNCLPHQKFIKLYHLRKI